MKKLLFLMTLIALTGRVYAFDASELSTVKADDVKKAAAEIKMGIPVPVKLESKAAPSVKFVYDCFSIDENEPYGINKIKLEVKGPGRPLTLALENTRTVITETYLINDSYTPKPGSSMEGFLQLNVENPHYSEYGEGPVTPFFIQKDLLTGGYKLNNGKMGGFIKTSGHGYSWAKYVCAR